MTDNLLDIDPPEHRRSYVRSSQTGDRGYLVYREGRQMVRLDRPGEDIVKAYNASEWRDDVPPTGLSEIQVAQIAFAADKMLCLHLRMPDKARREWLDLTDARRIQWVKEGPKHPQRAKLYALIKEGMRSE